MGGSVTTLLEIVKQVWLWCSDRKMFVTAVHIPGKDNIGPDNLSRIFNDSSEWKLKEAVFKKVCSHFYTPNIDFLPPELINIWIVMSLGFLTLRLLQQMLFPFHGIYLNHIFFLLSV